MTWTRTGHAVVGPGLTNPGIARHGACYLYRSSFFLSRFRRVLLYRHAALDAQPVFRFRIERASVEAALRKPPLQKPIQVFALNAESAPVTQPGRWDHSLACPAPDRHYHMALIRMERPARPGPGRGTDRNDDCARFAHGLR